mgnify:CR=1 FL=1
MRCISWRVDLENWLIDGINDWLIDGINDWLNDWLTNIYTYVDEALYILVGQEGQSACVVDGVVRKHGLCAVQVTELQNLMLAFSSWMNFILQWKISETLWSFVTNLPIS